jgi:WD repeat-containing protein 48
MGKFKGFGKKKQAEAPVSTVVEAPPPPPEDTVSLSAVF